MRASEAAIAAPPATHAVAASSKRDEKLILVFIVSPLDCSDAASCVTRSAAP
jgi:hypothetical protein